MQSRNSSQHPTNSPTALAGAALHSHWLLCIALASVFLFYGIDKFMATDTHTMGGMSFQVVLLMMAVYFLIRGNDT